MHRKRALRENQMVSFGSTLSETQFTKAHATKPTVSAEKFRLFLAWHDDVIIRHTDSMAYGRKNSIRLCSAKEWHLYHCFTVPSCHVQKAAAANVKIQTFDIIRTENVVGNDRWSAVLAPSSLRPLDRHDRS